MTTARALRGPFDYRLPDELREAGVEVGSMLVVPFGRRNVLGVVVGLADSSEVREEKLLAPLRALELGVPPAMVGLAQWIAAEYCSTLARALSLVLPPGATRRRGGRRRGAAPAPTHLPVGSRATTPPVLSGDQRGVLEALEGDLGERRFGRRLLHGVTGSGKTEVYLRAALLALEQGRGVIVLVPEIALTPQIVGRFIDRFGETVAVLHSQLRPAERYSEWRRLREGKAIVLLNRRGWSNFLSCRSCGRVWSCPHCDVALVLHRAAGYLACHHCGHRQPAPASCEQCLSTAVARHGAGTERVQRELERVLGDGGFPVFRLDADSVSAEPSGVAALLRGFENAECGALVGTQMVAKGHDFPDVSLGVVLDADATLRFPDFRAEERTFALIAQLAGRVGRGGEGHVLVQTIAPQARAIVHAAAHDSDGFLAGELERRRALGYPPFSHLIRIVCAAPESSPARAAAQAVRAQLDRAAPLSDRDSGVAANGDGAARRPSERAILGPAALFRLRGRERQMVLVKAADRRPTVRAVGLAVARAAAAREHAAVSFSVDVDPQ